MKIDIYRELKNEIVTLTPIAPQHRETLREAAKFDEIWKHTSIMNHYSDDLYNTWIALAYNNSRSNYQNCFVVLKDQKPVGSSRYYRINHDEKHLSIGFTWITPSEWGTKVNPSMKYLMLQNAFDNGFDRVYFHTDIKNEQSQTAIKKLGAIYTQTTKADKMRIDGSIRDTVEFVIEKQNWPQIAEKLLYRLQ